MGVPWGPGQAGTAHNDTPAGQHSRGPRACSWGLDQGTLAQEDGIAVRGVVRVAGVRVALPCVGTHLVEGRWGPEHRSTMGPTR